MAKINYLPKQCTSNFKTKNLEKHLTDPKPIVTDFGMLAVKVKKGQVLFLGSSQSHHR